MDKTPQFPMLVELLAKLEECNAALAKSRAKRMKKRNAVLGTK